MISALLYFFIFTSWGLGILAAFLALAMKVQENSLRVKFLQNQIAEASGKNKLLETLMSGRTNPSVEKKLPEELLGLMARSPEHPEVNEIEPGDEVFGVLFKSNEYPPPMEQDTEE